MREIFIEQVEIKRVEQLKQSSQDEIRDYLRGFARNSPSFIMAYGDQTNTLDNFDAFVRTCVFYEVTGITIDQFRYSRWWAGFCRASIFDSNIWQEATREFSQEKGELADYFKDQKEDIFDYIPPQKTNQIHS